MKFKFKRKKIVKLLWSIVALIVIIGMVGWSVGTAFF